MTWIAAIIAQLVHVSVMLAIAPALVGLVRWIAARLTGRRGPAFLQPWLDMIRLMRKQPAVAENASAVFALAPLLSFAAIAAAIALVPSFALGMLLSPLSDLLVIAGLMMLARIAMALAGMDVGTAIGGMGASRSMICASLAEPALLLVIFTLALSAGSSNLDVVAALRLESNAASWTSLAIALVAVVLVAFADIGLAPAHQAGAGGRLAMTQPATALEYGGPDLALINMTDAMRLVLWLNLIGAVFLPFGMASPDNAMWGWPLGFICWLGRLLLLAVALAAIQTALGRMRQTNVPSLLGMAALLALLAAAFLFAGARTA